MKSCPTCQGNYPHNFAVCPQDGTSLVELGTWVEGSEIRGKYRILTKVGQGGMGAVYKAVHLAFDELRALKVISAELMSDDLFVKRFKHEAVITRKLQHPNAVRVDDIDEAEDGRPFIVMEYIEGRSLKRLIQDEGPLPAPQVCSIIKQVSAALDAAHRLGMIHRDIKPENIVLIETAQGEQAKVLDFGIAKVKEARLGEAAGMTLTGTGVVIGTPQYMSPEQAMGKRGEDLDGRSDLYSLGVVMYQMLTADLPFKADTTMEMLLAHLQKPPAPIRSLHPELHVPEPVANLTMRLLEKDPNMRPASGGALIKEIEQAEETIAFGGTREVQRTQVLSQEENEVAEGFAAPQPAAVRTARGSGRPTAPQPQPSGGVPTASRPEALVRKPPAVAPAKESRWGLWLAGVILIAGLGGGGWYILGHRSTLQTNTQENATQPPKKTPPENPGQPQTSEQTPIQKPAAGEQTSQLPGPGNAVSPPQDTASTLKTPRTTTNSERRALRPAEDRISRREQNVETSRVIPPKPSVDPKKVHAQITLGDFYVKDGKYDDAIREYQRGLDMDPSNSELLDKIARARKAKAAEERLGIK